jgi:D-glycero-alpha-D-manno-heptose-7-phosphate kinase
LNVIEFNPDGTVTVSPVNISDDIRDQLDQNLKLYYLGNQRSASAILSEQKKNTSAEDKFKALEHMVSLVYKLRDSLEAGKLDDFGALMHENWLLKQQLASGITTPQITETYDAGLKAGALGGKLLGAGGGGFMLFYAPADAHEALDLAMESVGATPFEFSMEKEGSKLIHVER